jgi:hypothetical protein
MSPAFEPGDPDHEQRALESFASKHVAAILAGKTEAS